MLESITSHLKMTLFIYFSSECRVYSRIEQQFSSAAMHTKTLWNEEY